MANEQVRRLYIKGIIVLALLVGGGLVVWKGTIRLGLGLRGGSELRYRIKHEQLSPEEKSGITDRTITVIRQRIDPRGNKEIDIRRQGKYAFYIQLPGMTPEETMSIEDRIRRAGKLRFCLVNDEVEDVNNARRGDKILGHTAFIVAQHNRRGQPQRWRIARPGELAGLSDEEAEGWLLVEDRAKVTGEYLDNLKQTTDNEGSPALGFSFKGIGRRLFERVTDQNIGRRLAIILDRDLYSAPLIKSSISGPGIVSGGFGDQEVKDLLAILRAGRLPADIELEWNNSVGPQLGEDSIRSGLRACIVAFILVVAFMAAYYLLTGLIANFALMLNLLLVLALMVFMKTVLTLPGIAGLVLTLGMAVDANVLINERIREEREKGKTLGLAIRSGYERAFVTILDSNLTTLITALILFGVGTGPVKGFALTLSFGIIISMFTAIWVTRVIVDLFVERGWLHTLRMVGTVSRLLGKRRIPFTRIRHGAMVASLLAIVVGITVLAQRWEGIKGTDLNGGVRAVIELIERVPLSQVRTRVTKLFPGKADVQAVRDPDDAAGSKDPRRFSVRIRRLDEVQKLPKMRGDMEKMFDRAGISAKLKDGEQLYQFHLTLDKPISERALRKLLATEDYKARSIEHIVPVGQPASEYDIRLQGDKLSAKETPKHIASVLDALKAIIAEQDIKVRVGALQEEETPGPAFDKDAQSRTILRLPLSLSGNASTAAVRKALVHKVFGGKRSKEDAALRVVGDKADAGQLSGREMAILGERKILERIAGAGIESLEILAFSRPEPDLIRILTKAPLEESQLRSRLSEENLLTELVWSVIPLSTGEEFLISMHPLSEDKAVAQVRELLLEAFKKELKYEDVQASVVPAAKDPEVSNLAELKRKGYKFYLLKFDKALPQQAIHARVREQYEDALVESDLSMEAAVKLTDEVYLKLAGNESAIATTREQIAQSFAMPNPFRSIEAVGPRVAGEMQDKALLAVALSWVAIIFYIWFRFGEVKFGLAAVTALVHDVLLTLGAVGVADALSGTAIGVALGFSDIKINVTMVAAFLTLIGYSINDTIVVFDRIRENTGGAKSRISPALVDASINQILSRTILTSLTTFMVLIVLYIMGGPVLHGFAFVMAFGVLAGTYSSIFIASPILIGWENFIHYLQTTIRTVTFRPTKTARRF